MSSLLVPVLFVLFLLVLHCCFVASALALETFVPTGGCSPNHVGAGLRLERSGARATWITTGSVPGSNGGSARSASELERFGNVQSADAQFAEDVLVKTKTSNVGSAP